MIELHVDAINWVIWFIELAVFSKDCIMCNILLAVSSIFQHICRCFCARGCSVYEENLVEFNDDVLSQMVNDSHHILYTSTWLRGDHCGKCWRSSYNCAVLQVKKCVWIHQLVTQTTTTVGSRLSELQLSEHSIILTPKVTVLLEYFSISVFY